MAQHTPTPWRVEEGTPLIWGNCNPDDRSTYGMGYPVARVEHPRSWQKSGLPTPDEQGANAALIVRAVNAHEAMLAALKACADQFDFYVGQHLAKSPPDYAKAETNKDFAEKCRAAIRLAEGGM